MIEIDVKELIKLEADLKKFAARALPFATRQTINQAAFETMRGYKAAARNEMVLRNKWTEKSIQVEKSKTLRVSDQAAVVGSIAEYMSTQEFGGTERGDRGKHKPIATSYAAGQGEHAQPRTRLPRKPNKLSNIQLRRLQGRKAKTRKQAMIFAVQEAVLSGERTVYLDLGRRKGIFRVIGGRKKFKRGWPKGAKIKMLWDLSRQSVRVPRNPLLGPATTSVQQKMPGYYIDAIRYQLKRHKILGY